MEKETLEEAAYQARRNYQDEVGKDGMNECIMLDAMKIQRGFELGAKWQQEKSYSEEEVKFQANKLLNDLLYKQGFSTNVISGIVNEWFEQFKK